MKRMYLVLTVVALLAAMIIFAAPAMADDNRHENRIDRIEDRLENRGFDVDLDGGDDVDINELDDLAELDDLIDLADGDDVDVDVGFNDNGRFVVDVDV